MMPMMISGRDGSSDFVDYLCGYDDVVRRWYIVQQYFVVVKFLNQTTYITICKMKFYKIEVKEKKCFCVFCSCRNDSTMA